MKEWYQISAEEVKKEDGDLRTWTHNGGGGKSGWRNTGRMCWRRERKECFCGFFGQFADLLVGILIVAAAISRLFGNRRAPFVILVVIVLNALLGTIQYEKAEKSLESLKDLTSPNAKSAALRREGGDTGEGSRAGRPSAAGGGRPGGGGRQNPAQLFTAGE